jgi:tetratricopeptide (TPR) repeat protein
LKLARRPSESDIRAFFKKILDAKMTLPHLLEELHALYKESRIEDVELEKRILDYVELQPASSSRAKPAENHSHLEESSADAPASQTPEKESTDGLMILDELEPGQTGYMDGGIESALVGGSTEYGQSVFADGFASRTVSHQEDLPAGEGKEHYDLGAVYREMKLWDAAIAEFEQARRDPSCRLRATLAMSECLQESNDLQTALKLLEDERLNDQGAPHERLNLQFQLGVIYQTIGKLDEALDCFEKVRAQNAAYGDADERIAQLKAKLNQA